MLTVGAAILQERDRLLPLRDPFGVAEICFPSVNAFRCVVVRSNAYSGPAPTGSTVEVRLCPSFVEIWNEGRPIAKHDRCYGHQQQILDLEHYLDVLEHKTGAFCGSKPLAAWRKKGLWPRAYDQLLAELMRRLGRQNGIREMIQLFGLARQYGDCNRNCVSGRSNSEIRGNRLNRT